ncbi:biotin--[acetyl-CoA-carboxylase] ligase [Piscicoccus intestinalis]|uniref:biotin--[acetyl-CoA-carboxylase] ligase n=1 Tax=Piscicoccus intestinalis TaxID=746033 RepID=UPI000839833E|nr:biotin--[acetyl-CoA-carboxylase] ligase [Piscicoccus intestinalis]
MTDVLDSGELVRRLRHPHGSWRRVEVHEQIDSTNARALEEPEPWRIVVAAEQTAGRGRQGRSWSSPPGTSVAMSMVVPLVPRPYDVGWVPLAAGLAVAQALGDLTGRPEAFGVKWPNDVLAAPLPTVPAPGSVLPPTPDRKVCGILCQVVPGGSVVVGIGVNVSAPPESLPAAQAPEASPAGDRPRPPLVLSATSVRDCAPGPAPSREDVTVAVAQRYAAAHERLMAGGDDLDGLRAEFARACVTIGRDVEVYLPRDRRVVGHAQAVDALGELVVRDADTGASTAYAAGDVFHIRPLFGA